MVTTPFTIRLGVRDADTVRRALQGMGADGETALKKLDRAARQAEQGSRQARGAVSGLGRELSFMAGRIVGPAAALAALGGSITSVVKAGVELEKQQFTIAALLKTTENASGRTAAQIEALAQSIGRATLQSTEGARTAAAALLTFKNVSGDAFDRTLRAAADLSAVLGQDLRAAALQLGKALEDPERNLSQLNRSGISFTQTQIDLIKRMKETGDEAGALNEILKVIEGQVGGAGAAQAGGLAGAWDSFGEALQRRLEILSQTGGALERLAGGVRAVAGAMEAANERATPEGRLAAAQARLTGLETQRAAVPAGVGGLFVGSRRSRAELTNEIRQQQQAVADLAAELADYEEGQALAEAATRAGAAAHREAQAAARDEAKAKELLKGATALATKAAEDERKAREAASKRAQEIIAGDKKRERSLKDYIAGLEQAAELDGLSAEQKEIQRALIEAQNALLDEQGLKQRDLTEEEKKRIENAVRQSQAHEKAAAAAKKAAEKQARAIEHATERATDFAADALYDAFEGRIGDVGELLETTLKRAVAQAAAEAIFRPLIQPIIAGLAGGVSGGGGGGALGGVAGGGMAGGGASGGGMGGLFQLGSLANSSGLFGNTFSNMGASITGGINSFGTSLGFAPGTVMAAPSASFVGPMPLASGSTFGTTTLTGFMGGVGLGFGAGTMLNGWLGGNETNGTIGAGAGAAAGAAIGSIIPGVGTIIGGLIGGMLGGAGGGMLGPPPTVGPNGGATIGLDGSSIRLHGSGGDNGFDPGPFVTAANSATDTLIRIVEGLGGSFAGGRGERASIGSFASKGGLFTIVQPSPGSSLDAEGPNSRFFGSDSEAAMSDLLLRTLKNFEITGLAPEVATALQNSKATKIEGLLDDLNFAAALAGVEFTPEKITQAEQALRAINEQFGEMADRASALGLSTAELEAARVRAIEDLTEGFDAAIAAQIGAIVDPTTRAFEALAEAQENRLKEAEALGADLVEVERLSGLERKALLEQAFGDVNALLTELTVGGLSGATPSAQLAAARAAFESASASALAGETTPALAATVRAFVEASRAVNATGGGFGSDLASAVALLEQVKGLQGFAEGGVFVGPAIVGEGAMAEAAVPLPDGRRIPVDLRVQGLGGGRTDELLTALGRQQAEVGAAVVDELRAMRRDMAGLRAENQALRRELRNARVA